MVSKSQTQKKDEQEVLDYYEESKMFLSESDAETNVLIIMFKIQKRLDDIILKGIWLSKEDLTIKEVVQLLKEVCVTYKEKLMLSYTSDKCFPIGISIMSWVSMEQN